MNPLIKQLKKYGNLTSEIETELNEKIKSLIKQKGDFLLKEGQIVSSLFVIEKGLVRSFYNINEREINVWFGFESGILGSVMPLFFSQPSIENIQFLEDTTLYYISSNDLESFYKSSQEMNTIGRRILQNFRGTFFFITNTYRRTALSLAFEKPTRSFAKNFFRTYCFLFGYFARNIEPY